MSECLLEESVDSFPQVAASLPFLWYRKLWAAWAKGGPRGLSQTDIGQRDWVGPQSWLPG